MLMLSTQILPTNIFWKVFLLPQLQVNQPLFGEVPSWVCQKQKCVFGSNSYVSECFPSNWKFHVTFGVFWGWPLFVDSGNRQSLSISTCEVFERKQRKPCWRGGKMGNSFMKRYMAFQGILKKQHHRKYWKVQVFECLIVTHIMQLNMEVNV